MSRLTSFELPGLFLICRKTNWPGSRRSAGARSRKLKTATGRSCWRITTRYVVLWKVEASSSSQGPNALVQACEFRLDYLPSSRFGMRTFLRSDVPHHSLPKLQRSRDQRCCPNQAPFACSICSRSRFCIVAVHPFLHRTYTQGGTTSWLKGPGASRTDPVLRVRLEWNRSCTQGRSVASHFGRAYPPLCTTPSFRGPIRRRPKSNKRPAVACRHRKSPNCCCDDLSK